MGALDAPAAARLVPIASDQPRPASLTPARSAAVMLFTGLCHTRPIFSGLEMYASWSPSQAIASSCSISAASISRLASIQAWFGSMRYTPQSFKPNASYSICSSTAARSGNHAASPSGYVRIYITAHRLEWPRQGGPKARTPRASRRIKPWQGCNMRGGKASAARAGAVYSRSFHSPVAQYAKDNTGHTIANEMHKIS